MSVLLVEMQVRFGEEDALVDSYLGVFLPAIASQPGFERVRLLRPEDSDRWILEIEFIDEQRRLAWVATALHQKVWPQVETHCDATVSQLYRPAPAVDSDASRRRGQEK